MTREPVIYNLEIMDGEELFELLDSKEIKHSDLNESEINKLSSEIRSLKRGYERGIEYYSNPKFSSPNLIGSGMSFEDQAEITKKLMQDQYDYWNGGLWEARNNLRDLEAKYGMYLI